MDVAIFVKLSFKFQLVYQLLAFKTASLKEFSLNTVVFNGPKQGHVASVVSHPSGH